MPSSRLAVDGFAGGGESSSSSPFVTSIGLPLSGSLPCTFAETKLAEGSVHVVGILPVDGPPMSGSESLSASGLSSAAVSGGGCWAW